MADLVDPDSSLDGIGNPDEDSLGVDDSSLLDNTNDLTTNDTTANDTLIDDDPELEAIKARVREMEAEAEKLKEMQNEVEKQINLSPPPMGTTTMTFPTIEEKLEADGRSIYVGNVDYGATAEELEQHFHGCGSVNRVTILCNKYTGHPKGFAYIEFADKDAVETSVALDGSLFRGRQIKVIAKRTNKPGLSTTERGRGRGRGFHRGGRGYGGGYYSRPRRGGWRGRGRHYYSPY